MPLPWTERHRPATLDEVVGNPSAAEALRKWAQDWLTGRPAKPGVLLVGSAGTGKTTMAHALAREFKWGLVEMNASDARNKDAVTRIAGGGAMHQALTADGAFQTRESGGRSLILLDEADNLEGTQDRGGIQAFVQLLRTTHQPVILTANDAYALYSRGPALRGLLMEVKLRHAPARSVAKVLAGVCKAEGVEADPEALVLIAERTAGDVRAAVTDLESVAAAFGRVGLGAVEAVGERDASGDVFEFLRHVFGGRPKEARRVAMDVGEPPETLLLWLEHNLPYLVTNAEARARGMEALAQADLMLGRTRRRQAFRLWAHATDAMTVGVASAVAGQVKPSRYEFPEWLRHMSRSRATRGLRDGIAGKAAAQLHTGKREARETVLPLLAFLLERLDDHRAHALAKALELDPAEVAYLLSLAPTDERVKTLTQRLAPEEPAPPEPEAPEAGDAATKTEDRPPGQHRSLFDY